MKKIQSIRGTRDFINNVAKDYAYVVTAATKLARNYNYDFIITPIVEPLAVFTESLGQHSDIVHKEMFVFQDKGGDEICLRPENTAGVMRAFVENGLTQNLPCKFFYHGPMFRYERPQKGRYRQFHQFGVEYLHLAHQDSATIDAEVIALGYDILSALGIAGDITLELNSLGSKDDRAKYQTALVEYFRQYENDLSADSKTRLKENPLRILDSKDEGDRKILTNAPSIADYYGSESAQAFESLQEKLSQLNIPFKVNHHLVRGLDYYCHTAFEFVTDKLGAQGTVLAGGRYDGLIALFGGGNVAGVGFAMGLERLIELLPSDIKIKITGDKPLLFLCPTTDIALDYQLSLAHQLRRAGVRVESASTTDLKKSLSRANKLFAGYAIIFDGKKFEWKNLLTGEQSPIVFDDIIARYKKDYDRTS